MLVYQKVAVVLSVSSVFFCDVLFWWWKFLLIILLVGDVAFLKTIGIQKDPKKQNTPALLWPVAPNKHVLRGISPFKLGL